MLCFSRAFYDRRHTGLDSGASAVVLMGAPSSGDESDARVAADPAAIARLRIGGQVVGMGGAARRWPGPAVPPLSRPRYIASPRTIPTPPGSSEDDADGDQEDAGIANLTSPRHTATSTAAAAAARRPGCSASAVPARPPSAPDTDDASGRLEATDVGLEDQSALLDQQRVYSTAEASKAITLGYDWIAAMLENAGEVRSVLQRTGE